MGKMRCLRGGVATALVDEHGESQSGNRAIFQGVRIPIDLFQEWNLRDL
jgi:hypothetical protein